MAMATGMVAAVLAAEAVAYVAARRVRAGLPRLLLLAPFLPAFLLLPGHVTSSGLRGMAAFVVGWMCPTKLLLLCYDQFLDAHARPWLLSSFSHFLPAFLLPIRLKKPTATPASSFYSSLFKLPVYAPAIYLTLASVDAHRHSLPPHLAYVAYIAIVYMGLDLAHAAYACLMRALYHVDIEPSFVRPFAPSSLTDFWGRRWNLTVPAALHVTVYAPLLGALSKKGAKGRPVWWARAIAVVATFLVSGFVHEAIFLCMTRGRRPTWQVTGFFLVQGVATSAEVAVRHAGLGGNKVPRPVGVLLTVGFLYVTAVWLFLPPMLESGIDRQTFAEFRQLQRRLVSFWHRLS